MVNYHPPKNPPVLGCFRLIQNGKSMHSVCLWVALRAEGAVARAREAGPFSRPGRECGPGREGGRGWVYRVTAGSALLQGEVCPLKGFLPVREEVMCPLSGGPASPLEKPHGVSSGICVLGVEPFGVFVAGDVLSVH